MTSSATTDVRTAQRAALRRAVLHLVLSVIALDAVALALFYLGGVSVAASRVQTIFTVTWMVATAVVVAVLLRRVRIVRRGG